MKTLLKTLRTLVCFMMISSTLQAADRYWVGGTDSLWNKTANWSTTSGGSGGASVPGANDTTYFDANSSRNCYLNIATTLQYIHLQSGFTRSLFQQGNSITVNRKGLRVDAGTFEGGSGAITINAGGITLNGGTLNATSGTLTLLGSFTNTSGTFNHNNGTITLWNANTISGNALTVNHLQVRWGTYNINAAVTVNGTFTYINFGNDIAVLNSSGSGKLLIQGNIVLNNNRNGGGGSTVMEINGSGNQTINSTVPMFFCALPQIKIEKASGTLKFKGEVAIGGTWDYISGTIETDSATISFYNNIIKGNAHSISNLRLGFNSVNVQTALSINKRLIYHNNGSNPVGISVSNGGTVAVQGDVLLQNTRGGGSGNATLLFNGTGNQNIISTTGIFACELPNVKIEKPSGTLKLKGEVTVTGTWDYISGTLETDSATISFYNNIIKGNGHSISNLRLGFNSVNVQTALTITKRLIYHNNNNNSIGINVSNGGTVAVKGDVFLNNSRGGGSGNATLLFNGTGNQNITSTIGMFACELPNVKIEKPSGVLKLKGEVTVTGTWDYISGTLETDSATISFYNNIIKGNAHSISNLRLGFNSVNVQTALTITKRLIYHNNNNNSIGINVSNGGTVAVQGDVFLNNSRGGGSGNATLLFNGTGNQNITSTIGMFACELPHVKIEKPSGTLKLKGEVTVAGTWDYVSGTLETDSATISFLGSNIIRGNSHTLANIRVRMNYLDVQTALNISKNLIYHNQGSNPNGISVSNGGSVAVQGNILLQNTRAGWPGNATLTLNGTGTQLIRSTVGIGASSLPIMVINKASGTLQLQGIINLGTSWTHTQGTVDANTFNSTVVLSNQNNTINGKAVFDNLRIQSSDNLGITINDTITVKDTLLLSGTNINILNGKMIQAEGHIINTNTAYNGGGTATIQLTGSNNQTLAGLDSATVNAEGRGRLPRLSINKTSGTLTWRGVINVHGKLTWQQGFSDANQYSKVVLFETDSLLGNTAAAGLTPTTGNMAFYELKYMTNNTRKLQAPLAINRRLILGGSLLKLNSQALNINTKDSTAIEATARLLADDTTSKVIWQIGNSTRTYTVPFVNSSLQAVSLQADITQAGIGNNGSLTFNTYRSNSQNLPYPESNENSYGFIDSNRLKIADRYWLLQQANFDSLPTLTVRTQYAAQDLASPNTINEDSLNSSVFSLPCWTKKTGTLNKAQKHYTASNIKQARVALALHDKSVVPVCNDGSSCANAYLLTNADYNNMVFNMTDTVMWFRFVAEDSIWNAFCTNKNSDNTKFNLTNAKIYQATCNGTLKSNNNVIIDSVKYFIFTDKYVIGTSYFLKFTQPINNSSQFSLFRSKRSFNDCVLTSSSQSSCNTYLGATFGCSLICNPEICVPNPSFCNQGSTNSYVLDFCTNINGWGNFFGSPDYYRNRGIDPTSSGAIFMFSGFSSLTSNVNIGEGVYTSVNIEPSKKYLFSIYRQHISPSATDNSLQLIVSSYISGTPPQRNPSINYPRPLDRLGQNPPDTRLGNNILTENNIPYDNMQRVITNFTGTVAQDRLYIYPKKGNTSNGNTQSNILIDQVELIEDLFTAGPDKTTCPGQSIQIGENFCSLTDVKYEWFDANNQPIGTGQVITVNPTVTTTYRLTREFETFNNNAFGTPKLIGTNFIFQDFVTVNIRLIDDTYGLPTINDDIRTTCSLGPNLFSIANVAQFPTGTSFSWSVTNGTVSPIGNGTTANVTWTNIFGGTISVFANLPNGCKTSVQQFTINPCCLGLEYPNNIIIGDMNATQFKLLTGIPQFLIGSAYEIPKEILFNGVFTVDVNLNFKNCPKIRFGPDAEIRITGNARLEFDNCDLRAGCNTMWKGIDITTSNCSLKVVNNSFVKDAKAAVTSTGAGRYTLENSVFDGNYKHVVVNATTASHQGTITGTTFRCVGNLIAPYSSPAQKTLTAIEVNNVTGILQIGNHANNPNFFAHATYGIDIINSKVSVFNNSIGIYFSGLTPIFGQIKTGIRARHLNTINNNNIVTVGGTGGSLVATGYTQNFSNYFTGCDVAVDVNKYAYFNIKHNFVSIPSFKTGYRLAACNGIYDNQLLLAQINIEDNVLVGGNLGMNIVDNITNLSILRNTLDFTNSLGWSRTGIRVMGGLSGLYTYLISYPSLSYLIPNTIISDNKIIEAYWGIDEHVRLKSNILRNEIQLGTLPVSYASNYGNFGIGISKCDNSFVICNKISASKNISIVTNFNRYFGIQSVSSPSRHINNQLGKTLGFYNVLGRGFSFIGLQQGTKLLLNNIDQAYYNVAIGAKGAIGPQVSFSGNPLKAYLFDNIWGNDINTMTLGGSQGNLSTFMIRCINSITPLCPNYPTTLPNGIGGLFQDFELSSGASRTPVFAPLSSGIRNTTPLSSDFLCGGNINPSTLEVPYNAQYALQVVGDSIAYPNDSLLNRWWARYNLFISLDGQDTILQQYAAINSFFNSFKNSALPKIDSINTIVLSQMNVPFNELLYNNIISSLNGVNTTNSPEWFYKQYARLQAKLLKPAGGEWVAATRDTLNYIAQKCIFNGGPAVVFARSFFQKDSIVLSYQQMDNNCSNTNSLPRLMMPESDVDTTIAAPHPNISLKEEKYYLYPNPAKGKEYVSTVLPANVNGRLEVYGVDGRKYCEEVLKGGENQIALKGCSESGGVYIYRIYVNGKLNNTAKLVILP